MKNLGIIVLVAIFILSCKNKTDKTEQIKVDESVDTAMESTSQEEWETLSINDWQAFKGGAIPESWKEENGAIVFYPPGLEIRKKADGGNHSFNIVSKKSYTSFVLSMEWKISEVGNSGIMWGVSEDEKYGEPYQTGLEIQILDNEKHPDAKNGTTHQAGALYDLVEPSEDATKPIGEWNSCVITIDHGQNKGSSVLNGIEVATFPVSGEGLDALLKGSKFDGWDGFAKFKTGKIALQDHGDVVAFRNIKIKELK